MLKQLYYEDKYKVQVWLQENEYDFVVRKLQLMETFYLSFVFVESCIRFLLINV